MTVRQIPLPSLPSAGGSGSPFPRTAAGLVRAFGRDFGIVLSVIFVYFLLRGAAPDRLDYSVEVTRVLVGTERALGVFWEPTIQDWSIKSHAVKEFANFVYAYMHFPVLAVVGAWLWLRDREAFRFMRNVMFFSMAIGLVFTLITGAALADKVPFMVQPFFFVVIVALFLLCAAVGGIASVWAVTKIDPVEAIG